MLIGIKGIENDCVISYKLDNRLFEMKQNEGPYLENRLFEVTHLHQVLDNCSLNCDSTTRRKISMHGVI